MARALVCRGCGTSHAPDERFCPRCGMPLEVTGEELPPLTERRERARKVSPQYAQGELTKVGWARNQAEAELISGMLLEEGIPSVVRRAGGFDVPDFLAGGPRDILVAASGVEAARDLLGTTPAAASGHHPLSLGTAPIWVRALAVVLVTVTVAIVAAGVIGAFV